jgi:hypothetical protein
MTFVYVSGTGTDSTEKGNLAWARVKGRTENAILRVPFKAAYMFRPGVIQPIHGECAKVAAIRVGYALTKPLLPLLLRLFPAYPDHRRHGQGHDQRRPARRSQADSGDLGHRKLCAYNW